MSESLFIMAIISVVCGIVIMIMILSDLSKRGVKINYLLLRLYIIKYVSQYREITKKETGKPGSLFYPFIVSMNSAWIFAVAGLVLRNTIE